VVFGVGLLASAVLGENIIIIGASHAGISCAEQLRHLGFSGAITLIERQSGAPLERPPLSKSYLVSQAADDDKFLLRRPEWYEKFQVTMIDGMAVTQIDPAAHQLQLADGQTMAYGKLVLATGAVPRQLQPAAGLGGVHVLRNPDDAAALRNAMQTTTTAVVIGGGYIGLEAAASFAKAGLEVHVIEAADRLLARVASPDMSAFFMALHQDHGVQIHIGAAGTDIYHHDGHFNGVILADGQQIAAELLVVGIGVTPDSALAEAAGAATGNGILVDRHMRTTIDDIYAIGDVALIDGAVLRIESVHNAQDTAARAAADMTKTPLPENTIPWFWSEQYDVRLQSAGIVPVSSAAVQYAVRPGKREGGLSVWSYDQGQLVAVEAVRDPAAYMLGKKCLENNMSPAPSQIIDPAFDLKQFING
jgi:NADPH-dependent 2,4-dienoyl-CoA reductase/sulfur reductase-like enzyme